MAIIKATIKIKQDYVCSNCGNHGLGDQETHESTLFYSSEGIKQFIDSLELKATNMPIGWANSYDTGFQCSDCVYSSKHKTI